MIDQWPGLSYNAQKVPTLIKYKTDGTFDWGFNVESGTSGCIEWTKLLLDPDQPIPNYALFESTKNEMNRLEKLPIDVATDYLRSIFAHVTTFLEERFSPRYLRRIEKQYVLTVSATQSDKAKETTLEAAVNAGIFPVVLIKEHEAANLCVIDQVGKQGLEVGNTFVLCDAGGGTIDLSEYEIAALRPLQLKELVPANWDSGVSLMLYVQFGSWIRQVC